MELFQSFTDSVTRVPRADIPEFLGHKTTSAVIPNQRQSKNGRTFSYVRMNMSASYHQRKLYKGIQTPSIDAKTFPDTHISLKSVLEIWFISFRKIHCNVGHNG